MKKILFADSHYFDEYYMLGQRQYALQFSKNNWDTAFITNPLSIFNIFLGNNKRRIIDRLHNHFRGGTISKDNLWYYIPFTLIPFHNNTIFDKKWFLDNYYRFTIPPVTTILKKSGFSSIDILWIGTPHQKFLKDIIKYKCCVFRLADNTKEFKKSGNTLLKAQEEMLQSADIILVTSMVLLDELRNDYPDKEFIYCPNGVDSSNFLRSQYNIPEEYLRIKNPIALYIGAIEEWFDLQLVSDLAKRCPKVNFVIIGVDKYEKMKKFSLIKNIFYLGPKQYHDIPNYIYYCDCGIIPFNNSKLVQSVSPIKMYEFFILGKPVVSKRWKELSLLNSPCYLANDLQDFVGILNDRNIFSIDSTRLINYAQKNTWEDRYLKIITTLQDKGFI
ncbi:MAG: putative teichuronic acid biosynthesis glycosyltransferase TuaH [Bacteroidetes bacterium ADurb.Bin302]|nr:MAG: putative teichuronic acid biosynthesis glycosyltransferase TuaH [Bacteroidetes bacterium ADurb.Bin302]